ncbi:hypothetical protein ACJ41P_26500 [Azospirillum argentinense]|uniref:Uncharacterized protein n=1 Tax=Azospirillum argentinense TaxID=2970906 RepID=A0ABW8VHA9_9PROT
MAKPKSKPSIVVEIPQFTGVRLSDASIRTLERLLAEVGSVLAADYPAPVVGNREALDRTTRERMGCLIQTLERSPGGACARPELVASAACVLAQVCVMDIAAQEMAAAPMLEEVVDV